MLSLTGGHRALTRPVQSTETPLQGHSKFPGYTPCDLTCVINPACQTPTTRHGNGGNNRCWRMWMARNPLRNRFTQLLRKNHAECCTQKSLPMKF